MKNHFVWSVCNFLSTFYIWIVWKRGMERTWQSVKFNYNLHLVLFERMSMTVYACVFWAITRTTKFCNETDFDTVVPNALRCVMFGFPYILFSFYFFLFFIFVYIKFFPKGRINACLCLKFFLYVFLCSSVPTICNGNKKNNTKIKKKRKLNEKKNHSAKV